MVQLYWCSCSSKYRKHILDETARPAAWPPALLHVQPVRWWILLVTGNILSETAAYCLLLGGIKLCVLLGCCGGGGIYFLCDMGHWLFFQSSGTIMRFFFPPRISVPPFSALIVFMKLCIHLSMPEQGEGKAIFKTLANCFLLLCTDW